MSKIIDNYNFLSETSAFDLTANKHAKISRFYRHKKYQKLIKLSCLLVISLLAMWILAAKYFTNENKRIYFTYLEEVIPDLNKIIKQPVLRGVNSDNRLYIINADHATEIDNNAIAIEKLTAQINLKKDKSLEISSSHALLLKNKNLELQKDVTLRLDDSYNLQTASALVNLRSFDISGNDEVLLQNAANTIKAKGFNMTDKGNIINFAGPVEVDLFPSTDHIDSRQHPRPIVSTTATYSDDLASNVSTGFADYNR